MADALCGPSNPLQNFQKATSVDRTLQQDRLRSHLPSHVGQVCNFYVKGCLKQNCISNRIQGFRSPDPRLGSLDAEFAAFEAGQPFDQTIAAPPPNAQLFTTPHLQHNGHQQDAGLSSWAADFQRLRLASPGLAQSPVPQAQFRNEAPMHRSTPAAGWHNEFLKHQQTGGAAGKTIAGSAAQNTRQPNTVAATSGFSPLISHDPNQNQFLSPATQYGQIQQHFPNQPQSEALDEAAFEAAFAEAASADLRATSSPLLQTNLQQPSQMTTTTSDSNDFQSASQHSPPTTVFPKIGSDLIPPTTQNLTSNTTENQQEQEQPQQATDADADSLALTAGELLHSVKDDSSEKFQQSNFLALMRRLRDREVVVRGDDIVENGDNNRLYNNEPLFTSEPTPAPAEIPQPLQYGGQTQQAATDVESSSLHPGGPSYPSPPPPARAEEHFLDTFPRAAGAGASQAGDLR